MADTMRAARFDATSRRLEVQDVPVPVPSPTEVLVRVEACGICLSDVHLLDGTLPAVLPVVTPGHEAAGTVEAVGDLVPGWTPGDRVLMAGGRNCGTCRWCVRGRIEDCEAFQILGFNYDGAWAQYVVVPYGALTGVPAGLPVEQAAILADAVSTPYAALTDRAALRPGEAIGLWGIGGLGVHAVQVARMVGAAPIIAIDPLPSARERALRLGADVALDPRAVDVVEEVRSAARPRGRRPPGSPPPGRRVILRLPGRCGAGRPAVLVRVAAPAPGSPSRTARTAGRASPPASAASAPCGSPPATRRGRPGQR
jgi:D-arabinose 1-dehydrogenase-like Zn-dependent alcohol dehydrogenase